MVHMKAYFDTVSLKSIIYNNFSSVNGGWTFWTVWYGCEAGRSGETRNRSCTNPPKKNCGFTCIGSRDEYKICEDDGKEESFISRWAF